MLPRRHPSIEIRESAKRSASKASVTASIGRVEPSSNPTSESPSIVRWNSRIPKEDRMDRDSLRIKVKLLLLKETRGCTNTFDAVFVAAPTGSGKSTLFEAKNLVFGKRAMTIIISPLNALSEHQAAKLCMRGKMAVVVSKKTWEDGKLYEQLKDPLCEVEYIFIKCMRATDPIHFAPSMLKLFNNVSELVVKLCSLLRVRHPTKLTKF
ncbi:BZ3500_MvSof-1268-A1-R1_Chr5-3g08256 [Microbotryum saponariae]|uniref:BZ3500_MvSof-1268-A1-R1_Chr5-3g08256 protein n=1 Tax=Microbotryum saponariae TaxID=289078 RepID=A0A2X0L8A0_9BASI|nr:BZ3500_MvSof-1268-A1-R1_Chr5-3g08256 [Microbotryum saponariae]SDA08364.1 BZ3501_MvSof-1269-A2-R1_Chr5-3g07984 [Microbotryum saponariae]